MKLLSLSILKLFLTLNASIPEYAILDSSRVSSLSSYSADTYCVDDSNISGG